MANFNDTFKEDYIRIGLSTDTKPTDGVENGEIAYELDNQSYFCFYNGTWYPVE